MSKAQDINRYRFTNTDKLFFDANIWILIYGPQGNPKSWQTAAYSNAFANAIRAKSQIFIDVLVVSEFINRFARLEHQVVYQAGLAPQDFKRFRNTPDFLPIAQAISAAARNILRYAARTDSGFSGIDIQGLLAEFEAGGNDFNDQMLVRLCQTQNLQLVTHDADFKGKGVNILTVNRRILAP